MTNSITNNLKFKQFGLTFTEDPTGLFIVSNIHSVNVTTNDTTIREQPSSGDRGVSYFETVPYEGELVIKGLSTNVYELLLYAFDNQEYVDFYVQPKAGSKDLSGIIYKYANIATLPPRINFVGDSSTNDFTFTITGSSTDISEYDYEGNQIKARRG